MILIINHRVVRVKIWVVMESQFSDRVKGKFQQWHLINELRVWKGFNITIRFGSYMNFWWIKNKSNFYLDVMNKKNMETHPKFCHDFEELPLPIKKIVEVILQSQEVTFHKSILVEDRSYILLLIRKKHQNVQIDFFSKNFSIEKILLKHFLQRQHHLLSEELLTYLNKSQELLMHKNSLTELEILTKTHGLPDLLNSHCSPVLDSEISMELSLRTKAYATTLLNYIGEYNKTLFEKISDYGLSLVSEYEALRIHLLKFLATLPCLDHDIRGTEVKRLFVESLQLLRTEKQKNQDSLPILISLFLPIFIIFAHLLPAFFLALMLRKFSKMMAQRFIAGENIKKSLPTLRKLSQSGRDATLDQLGELVLCEEEADHYKNKVLEIITGLRKMYSKGERNEAGILRAHISVKTTALGSQLKPHAFEDCYQKIAPRLIQILMAAKEAQVFVNIDAEHYHFRDVVWKIYSKVLFDHKELYNWKDTGIVVQAYLVDAIEHLKDIQKFQSSRKVIMPIRLVKGAYWDAETIEASAHHYHPPQFLNKIETDIHFRQLAYQLLSFPYTQLVVASHNVVDHCYVESLRTTLFPQTPMIEHQCLHMTYEALSVSLVHMGYAVRNYMPVGNMLIGMAYLVRRIMENSSQVGVLKMMRSHQTISPEQDILQDWLKAKNSWVYSDLATYKNLTFENVAPARLYLTSQWTHFERVKNALGLVKIPLEHTRTEQVHPMMSQMHEAWSGKNSIAEDWIASEWRKDEITRSLCLMQMALWLEIFRDEIAIIIIQEAYKSITEAYADVDEAIDFINYYVAQYLENFQNNNFHPLGVVAVIAPWNFPLAIPLGMSVAPLMAGNAVVMKSAEQTPQIGQIIENFLHLAGVPQNIFKHFIGSGQTIGQAMTQSLDLHGLVFTGSAAVGTMLYKNLSHQIVKNKLSQQFIRPVITEMGGKNAIIVTQNAELDETIAGILYSAFAHAGQKCSACSRVLVDKKILPIFKKRLLAAIRSIKTGMPSDPAVVINPVITAEDKLRLIDYKTKAVEEALSVGGKVLLDLQTQYQQENLIGPLVIELPADRAKHVDSYSHKEAFGPIIHVIGFSHLNQALQIANSTNYALTSGLYSQSPKDIEYFIDKIESGNVYLNRPNTGARVGIEPFGGFKLSGTGPKAGGRHYMQSFVHDNLSFLSLTETMYESYGSNDTLVSKKLNLIYPLPAKVILSKTTFNKKTLNAIRSEIVHKSQNLSSEQKVQWESHVNFLVDNFHHIESLDNTYCPGQKSYSRWDLHRKLALFWQAKSELDYKDLLFITYAVAKNIPFIVIAKSEIILKQWNKFKDILANEGHPKDLIVIWEGNEDKILLEIGKLNSLDLCHLAITNENDYNSTLKKLITHFSYGQNLPLVSSSFVSWLSLSPKHLSHYFAYERAYAINIMRHGAPLENA